MKRIAIIAVVLSTACASLPPADQRKAEFVEETKATKGAAFTKMNAYIAKNWGDSNKAIKMKDENAGQIIVKGHTPCNVMRQSGDTNDYSILFDLDFQAKDYKAKFSFEDLRMIEPSGAAVTWDYNQITSPDKVEKVKAECLAGMKNEMLKAINGGSW